MVACSKKTPGRVQLFLRYEYHGILKSPGSGRFSRASTAKVNLIEYSYLKIEKKKNDAPLTGAVGKHWRVCVCGRRGAPSVQCFADFSLEINLAPAAFLTLKQSTPRTSTKQYPYPWYARHPS